MKIEPTIPNYSVGDTVYGKYGKKFVILKHHLRWNFGDEQNEVRYELNCPSTGEDGSAWQSSLCDTKEHRKRILDNILGDEFPRS